jgi:Fe-S cluster biogenesis protein NfuA
MMEASLPQRLQQLERRLRELESGADTAERDRARELVETVLELHGSALARLLQLIAQAGEPGTEILGKAAQDELVRSVLVLHGLHAQDLESRVVQALAQVRPFLRSQGADVELTAIAEDAVRLRLLQGEGGFPASRQTLQAAIEEAICAAAPDACHIEFVDEPARLSLPVLNGNRQS